jgi:methyltransferase-like protein
MFLGNQKEQAASLLADITDIVRQEQYMDFLNNRSVRKSLLVKKGARVERNISPSSVSTAYFLPNYGLKHAVSAEGLLTSDTLDLVRPNDPSSEASLSGSLACACYIALLEKSPVPQSLNNIMGTVLKTQPDTKAEEIEAAWNSIVINLISSGVITLTANNGDDIASMTNKPEVFKVARHQGKSSDIVTNLRHGTVRLEDDHRLIIQYVTGENTIDQIVGFAKEHVKKNELTISVDDKAVDASVDKYDEQLKSYVLNVLGILQANALLINGDDDA